MRRTLSILVLCIGILQYAGAQTFTQRLQKLTIGQGTVTIHHSADIDQLVNSTVLGNKPVAPEKPKDQTSTTHTSTSSNTTSTSTTTTATPQEETEAKVVRSSYKTTGYRVQAFAGGNSRADRQQAERIRDNIKASYPNVPVYVHFYSPRWICRVGNYRTYEEAHQMLVSLRNLGFDQATIVKGKITVSY
jgi:cytoskeletal protein RodZ